MCRGHIYVRMCPYTRVCCPHTRVHTYTNFARVYVPCFHMLVQFVCVRVCVFPSEMECVLFYSRKIAHRANVICCIMYPTLNKFYLISSYLILCFYVKDTLLYLMETGMGNISDKDTPIITFLNIETEMSFWWHFHQWLHRKLSIWQLTMQRVMKIS